MVLAQWRQHLKSGVLTETAQDARDVQRIWIADIEAGVWGSFSCGLFGRGFGTASILNRGLVFLI